MIGLRSLHRKYLGMVFYNGGDLSCEKTSCSLEDMKRLESGEGGAAGAEDECGLARLYGGGQEVVDDSVEKRGCERSKSEVVGGIVRSSGEKRCESTEIERRCDSCDGDDIGDLIRF